MNRKTRTVRVRLTFEGENPLGALAMAANAVKQALENLPAEVREQLEDLSDQETPLLAAPENRLPLRLSHKNGAHRQ